MRTFQDFSEAGENRAEFIGTLIGEHIASQEVRTARSADEYDAQRNETVRTFTRLLYTANGSTHIDFTAANNRIASNFFARLNTQRCTYLLGNGVTFSTDGTETDIKSRLGGSFDAVLKNAGYYALIHGVSFVFWNYDKAHLFKLTEFAPLWDEDTGALRAGVRFWRLTPEKPMYAVLYEEDGYTKYRAEPDGKWYETQERRSYKQKVLRSPAGDVDIIGGENYSALPIVPFWGSRLRQSTLVGMREKIDSFDLIRSGFANDLSDCAEIYWLVENYGGMNDADLSKFRDRLKLLHIANIDASDGGKVTPYTQEIPFEARKAYLDMIRAGIYEDFGGIDVHTVAAGATNDHIDAAYQPLDENADDFEFQAIECIQQILAVAGMPASTPIFKRNRISNVKEQVEVLMLEAPYLDDETLLNHMPNITPDEVPEILSRRDGSDLDRFSRTAKDGKAAVSIGFSRGAIDDE